MRTATGLLIVMVMATGVSAQTLQQRMEGVRHINAVRAANDQARLADSKIAHAVNAPIRNLVIDNLTARNAVTFLSTVSGIPIVINWERMKQDGIDPEQQVTLVGNITVEHALDLLAKQVSPDEPLIWEVTPWYVEIITKAQANTRMVTMIYPIGDLLHRAPDFDDAPSFNLVQITQGNSTTAGSGGGGASQQSPFTPNTTTKTADPTPAELGAQIADTVRESVEPEVWKENGGSASIVYFNSALVVRAPMYVQRKIGGRGGLGAGGLIGSSGETTEEAEAVGRPGVAVDNSNAYSSRYVGITTGGTGMSVQVNSTTVAGPGSNSTGTTGSALPYSRGHNIAGVSQPEFHWR